MLCTQEEKITLCEDGKSQIHYTRHLLVRIFTKLICFSFSRSGFPGQQNSSSFYFKHLYDKNPKIRTKILRTEILRLILLDGIRLV